MDSDFIPGPEELQMFEQEQLQDNIILQNQGRLTYEVQKNARFVAPQGLMGKL